MPRKLGSLRLGPPLPRAGLYSRKDTRDARVCVEGVAANGRRYLIDGPSETACLFEELNHKFWSARGHEPKDVKR